MLPKPPTVQKPIGAGIANEILMHFRSQKKSSGDVSLSDYIETGKDGNALSLMDVICTDDDLFEDLSARENAGRTGNCWWSSFAMGWAAASP